MVGASLAQSRALRPSESGRSEQGPAGPATAAPSSAPLRFHPVAHDGDP